MELEQEQELKTLAINFVKAFNEFDQFNTVMSPDNKEPLSNQTKMEIEQLVNFVKLNN